MELTPPGVDETLCRLNPSGYGGKPLPPKVVDDGGIFPTLGTTNLGIPGFNSTGEGVGRYPFFEGDLFLLPRKKTKGLNPRVLIRLNPRGGAVPIHSPNRPPPHPP